MNRKTLFCLLAAAFLAIFALAACSRRETGGSQTAATTTEAVTTIPRYDYFAAEVSPNVALDEADYTDVTLTIDNALRVDEQDVKDYLEVIRFQHRTAENGEVKVTDKALKMGDSAFIYYRGFINGEEFEGGSNWDDTTPTELGLGSGQFIPGFESGLVGVAPNSTSRENPFELQVTFPEDYKEELAGKSATFQVYIEYAVQYVLPELTKDFIINTLEHETQKSFYASDKALLTELESLVRNQLEEDMEKKIVAAEADAMYTYLVEKAAFTNMPADEINYYFTTYKTEVEYYYSSYSASNEEFKKIYPDIASFAPVYFNFAKGADWETELHALAERMVKKDMLVHALAERMGMETVTDDEYQAQVDYWVNYYQGYMNAGGVEANFGKSYLMHAALAEKMQKTLLERFTFTYEDGTPVGDA